jgi:glutathione S-transferase
LRALEGDHDDYQSDQKPASRLAAAAGTLKRYRLQEMLTYLNSKIHKTYGPMFNPAITASERADKIAYLFTVTNWADHLKVDLSKFPKLLAFQEVAAVAQRFRSAAC